MAGMTRELMEDAISDERIFNQIREPSGDRGSVEQAE